MTETTNVAHDLMRWASEVKTFTSADLDTEFRKLYSGYWTRSYIRSIATILVKLGYLGTENPKYRKCTYLIKQENYIVLKELTNNTSIPNLKSELESKEPIIYKRYRKSK